MDFGTHPAVIHTIPAVTGAVFQAIPDVMGAADVIKHRLLLNSLFKKRSKSFR
ncbi:hypothetical protein UY9_07450 [Bacillus atrophaeus C89]|nr:hypothetical protein UY9_07450 [Bacillus atrophaeus C89]